MKPPRRPAGLRQPGAPVTIAGNPLTPDAPPADLPMPMGRPIEDPNAAMTIAGNPLGAPTGQGATSMQPPMAPVFPPSMPVVRPGAGGAPMGGFGSGSNRVQQGGQAGARKALLDLIRQG